MNRKSPIHYAALLIACVCGFSIAQAAPALTIKGGGKLIVNGTGTVTVTGADILIETGGEMNIATGSETNADVLEIQELAKLVGCGTVNATINNSGLILGDCGTSPGLTLTGTVNNSGEVVLFNNTRLTATDSPFVNTGFLDLRHGDKTQPTNYSGNGAILLDADDIWADATSIVHDPPDVTIQVRSSMAYNYQLQYSSDFITWINIPGVQAGGGTITFVHSGGTELNHALYYRVVETIP